MYAHTYTHTHTYAHTYTHTEVMVRKTKIQIPVMKKTVKRRS